MKHKMANEADHLAISVVVVLVVVRVGALTGSTTTAAELVRRHFNNRTQFNQVRD